ncbi:hypothetical protein F0562_024407 [Nyssa sinensis]|uniref:Uncharacterized protein n=1 Tax=Nyssa sinensis TaxID=561372 RepID=A0A5J5BDD6_9ASTE|nr:hypothetical protein F0562_024407 [Nyssa sinensis]
MECNKDEAVRAKAIAEKKFTEKDLAGAKKFALKAQNLFPGLDDLPQFLATLEVYISAQKKINEAEFKGYYQKVTTGNPSVPAAGKNGFHAYTGNNNSSVRDQKSATYHQPTPAPSCPNHQPTPAPPRPTSHQPTPAPSRPTNHQPTPGPPRPSKPNTFWTACNRCKMQYEYLRNYLNQNLICPNCRQPFFALEMPAPPINSHNLCPPWPSYHQQQNAKHHPANNSSAPRRKPFSAPNMGTPGFGGVGSINSTHVQQGPFFKAGSDRNAPASDSSSAQAPNVVQSAYENLKRGREEVQTSAAREEAIRRRSNASKKKNAGLASNAGSGSGKGVRPMKKRRIDERKLELRNMLMAKAKREICKKLNEWSVTAALKASHKEVEMEKPEVTENCMQKASVNGVKNDENNNGAFLDTKKQVQPKKSSPDISSVDSDTKGAEIMTMIVPDPDFHDFDKDRTEKSFGENQVWAAYDDDDGMPRYYALIHSVLSKRPFKMRISWLNTKSNSELGPINWVGSGFPKTSGDFRIGKYEVNGSLNSFSHRVKWIKGARGVIQIFPRKGDVWALYRNWSPDWNELTPDEVIHKYDMVEVLEDYNEDQGVSVAPLVKVAGFKSVFHQHLDPREVRTFPREEMFRFSHQVPSYLLTGEEARNAPKGCRELDPAAMPLELLQVITEGKVVEPAEAAENVIKEDGLEGS